MTTPSALPAPLRHAPPCQTNLKQVEIVVMLIVSTFVLVSSYRAWWPITVTEAWGFVTGGVCVWLVVREHVWNWPVGLANNVFFFVLFLQGRLYADMGLQVVYLGLGIYGWLNWLYGGQERSPLHITRTTKTEWFWLAVTLPSGIVILREILLAVNGAAPLWDAVTTILSLAAQYLLCRKRLENWIFWMAADIIYVPLYLSRALPLTAVLYGVFLVMCVVGACDWRRKWRLEAPR